MRAIDHPDMQALVAACGPLRQTDDWIVLIKKDLREERPNQVFHINGEKYGYSLEELRLVLAHLELINALD